MTRFLQLAESLPAGHQSCTETYLVAWRISIPRLKRAISSMYLRHAILCDFLLLRKTSRRTCHARCYTHSCRLPERLDGGQTKTLYAKYGLDRR